MVVLPESFIGGTVFPLHFALSVTLVSDPLARVHGTALEVERFTVFKVLRAGNDALGVQEIGTREVFAFVMMNALVVLHVLETILGLARGPVQDLIAVLINVDVLIVGLLTN